jgi:hypothetical protein
MTITLENTEKTINENIGCKIKMYTRQASEVPETIAPPIPGGHY